MNVNPSAKIERRFVATMNGLVRTMTQFVREAESPQEALHILTLYSQSQVYKDWCTELATKVTTQVNEGVSKTWRKAAEKAGRGSEIYSKVKEEVKSPDGVFWLKIKENARLIQTFPLDVSTPLTEYIAKESLKGRRSEDILKDLEKKFPTTAKSRLRLIARTEVSKTQTALTQSKAVGMGLNWYIWKTSEDERVRGSHAKMLDVLINWNDPPSPERLVGMKDCGKYHAGDIYNCRCYPEPVVDFDFIDFPAKVYYNGAIRVMSRKQFEKIA